MGTVSHPSIQCNSQMDCLHNLLVTCVHHGCPISKPFGQLKMHLRNCSIHPDRWCNICEVTKESAHHCQEFIRKLKEELAQAQTALDTRDRVSNDSTAEEAQLRRMIPTVSVQALINHKPPHLTALPKGKSRRRKMPLHLPK